MRSVCIGLWVLALAAGPAAAELTFVTETLRESPYDLEFDSALDSEGALHLLLEWKVVEAVGPHVSSIVYTTNASGVWIDDPIPWSDGVVGSPRLDVAPDGSPHVVFARWSQRWYARRTGGSWEVHALPYEAEQFQFAVDSTGEAWISHEHSGDLYLARFDGVQWNRIQVPTPEGAAYHSLAIDADDRPHLFFDQRTSPDLRWARYDDPGWTSEGIPGEPSVGLRNDIAVDSSGQPHVAYYRDLTDTFGYARREPGGWWRDTGSRSGRLAPLRILLDAWDAPHVVTRIFDVGWSTWLDGTLVTQQMGLPQPVGHVSAHLTASGAPLILSIHDLEWPRQELRLTTLSPGGETPPAIVAFTAEPLATVAGDPVQLTWDTDGAMVVRIDPVQGTTTQVEGELLLRPQETTVYDLTATNLFGSADASLTVEVSPFRVDRFEATPPALLVGQTTRLDWNVRGEVTVHLEGIGPQDQHGFLYVSPTETTTYTLVVEVGGEVERVSVTVEVFDIPVPELQLSWQPDRPSAEQPELTDLQPFDVHVLLSGWDAPLAGYEFGLDVPPELLLIGATTNPPTAINVGQGTNYIVGTGGCEVPLPHWRVLTLTLFPLSLEALDQQEIALRAAQPASLTGETAVLDCTQQVLAVDHGPPLVLQTGGGGVVPVSQLEVSAQPGGGGIELRWSRPPGVTVSAVQREAGGTVRRWPIAPSATNWIDDSATPGVTYTYRLEAVAADGTVLSARTEATLESTRLQLHPNFPNPFTSTTQIRFALPSAGWAEIDVFDLAGRRVRDLSGSYPAGTHVVQWDGLDDAGRSVANGRYLVRLRTAAGEDTRSVLRVQ